MQAIAERYITEEEYWALEQDSLIKHEYFDGCIYAMSGASPRHNIVAANSLGSLVAQLRGKPCRAVGSDQRVKVEATGLSTYPDIVVYCQPARFEPRRPDTLLNPKLIIEVLSPSTAAYDKGVKFDHYKQLESLSDYLLIAQDRVQIDHYHRLENGDWLLHTAPDLSESIELESIGCALLLTDVYDGVELLSTPQPLRAAHTEDEVSE